MRTRSQLEADLVQVLAQFFKEATGRGPLETKVSLLSESVLARCRGVLGPAEKKLVEAQESAANREALRQLRLRMVEQHRGELERQVGALLGVAVAGVVYDLLAGRDECVLVLLLESSDQVDSV